MNPDFKDMLSALSAENAEFLVVGAYALAAHGMPRATGDIDIWIRPTGENSTRVWAALKRFRAPLGQRKLEDFTEMDVVFQMGVAPYRIDLLTSIDGVTFDDAWQLHAVHEIDGLKVPIISREHLIQNKRAAGRPKDMVDVAWLEGQQNADN